MKGSEGLSALGGERPQLHLARRNFRTCRFLCGYVIVDCVFPSLSGNCEGRILSPSSRPPEGQGFFLNKAAVLGWTGTLDSDPECCFIKFLRLLERAGPLLCFRVSAGPHLRAAGVARSPFESIVYFCHRIIFFPRFLSSEPSLLRTCLEMHTRAHTHTQITQRIVLWGNIFLYLIPCPQALVLEKHQPCDSLQRVPAASKYKRPSSGWTILFVFLSFASVG